jgi:hypothetical protein
MRESVRRRLIADVRVSDLIIEELRAALRECRPVATRVHLRKAAEKAGRDVRDLVWNYYNA